MEAPAHPSPGCSSAVDPETAQQEKLTPASSSSSVTPSLSSPSQFQDIPLDMTAEEAESSRKPDGQLVEEHPLLASKDAPLTEAASPSRAEGLDGPKRKTCQCCSLM